MGCFLSFFARVFKDFLVSIVKKKTYDVKTGFDLSVHCLSLLGF